MKNIKVSTHTAQSSIMMERMLLGIFYLTGLHIFSSCLPHQYHYVNECMNWTEAQTYCRKTYTDLATIENTEEMNQLNNTVLSSGYSYEVWIGLYGNVDWRWSDGYRGSGAEYTNWGANEPNDQFCVVAEKSGSDSYSWVDRDCTSVYPFFCYTGTQQDPVFHYVYKYMNWSSAQGHCRVTKFSKEKSIDLATVKNDKDNQQINMLITEGDTAWIGLFRGPGFDWSDGSISSFRNWEEGSIPTDPISVTGLCGVATLQGSQKWNLSQCGRRLPFVCYSGPPTPVRNQVVKLRIKSGDSSMNLNDPAVKAKILEKLQDKLKEKGVSGVTLKWREQPDGNVFHKETKNSEKKLRKKTEF